MNAKEARELIDDFIHDRWADQPKTGWTHDDVKALLDKDPEFAPAFCIAFPEHIAEAMEPFACSVIGNSLLTRERQPKLTRERELACADIVGSLLGIIYWAASEWLIVELTAEYDRRTQEEPHLIADIRENLEAAARIQRELKR